MGTLSASRTVVTAAERCRANRIGCQRPWLWPAAPKAVLILLLTSLHIASATEVWLGGFDPVMWSILRPGVSYDYYELFSPSAPWPQAAARVNVFQITGSLVGGGTEQNLRQIIAELQRRKIALAMAISPLTTKASCGQGVEGYGPPGEVERLVQRIRHLGGNLRYIAMDGPFTSGHIYDDANACHTPVPALAQEVAATVGVIKRTFPDAQVGDIEGIGHADPPNLTDQILQWTKAYEAAVGAPLAFLRTDILWTGPWHQQLEQLAPGLRSAGIKLSIIYNGDPSDQTDLDWTGHAEQRFAAIEAEPALIPDQAVLQTWMAHPSHMMPET